MFLQSYSQSLASLFAAQRTTLDLGCLFWRIPQVLWCSFELQIFRNKVWNDHLYTIAADLKRFNIFFLAMSATKCKEVGMHTVSQGADNLCYYWCNLKFGRNQTDHFGSKNIYSSYSLGITIMKHSTASDFFMEDVYQMATTLSLTKNVASTVGRNVDHLQRSWRVSCLFLMGSSF